MNAYKISTAIVSLTLLAVLSPMIFVHQAFATEQGMSLMATASGGSSTISISGHTADPSKVVTVSVISPNGNLVTVDQVTPDANGDFMTKIQTNSALWKQDGMYKVTAQQGTALMYKITVQVEVVGGATSETSVSESSLKSRGLEGMLTSEAPSNGLIVNVDAGGTVIAISGHTDRINTAVTITVKAPNGNLVTVDQVTPDANGDFMTKIQTNSALWKQDGMYKVTAQQVGIHGYNTSTEVQIAGGAVIPEFGTVAALILAVAIISIIAVSAKSRLSILPKY